MKTIIVPVDLSDESLNGLNLAFMLAAKTGTNILLAHVIVKNTGDYYEQAEKEKQIAQKKFEGILREYKEKVRLNFSLSYIIKEGNVFKEIADLADKHEDPLTVLSTHGTSGFEELFIGGNAYKIVSHSRNPVITVRRSKIPSNIDNIVLPLDITFQTREKVPYTVNLAKTFGSKIHLLTIRLSNLKSIEKKLHQYAEQVASYIESHKIPYVMENLHGRHAAEHVAEVKEVTEVRARWLGHRLHAEVNVTLASQMTLRDAHTIAEEVRHQLLHHLKYLSLVVIHVDPEEKSGERHHRIEKHAHDGLPAHSHAA
jgi:nucleotide-binding universal stress UspA family protein